MRAGGISQMGEALHRLMRRRQPDPGSHFPRMRHWCTGKAVLAAIELGLRAELSYALSTAAPEGPEVTKASNPDFEETRTGFRSAEGVESVLRHLMAAASRRQRQKSQIPDSGMPSLSPSDGEGGIDIPLPP